MEKGLARWMERERRPFCRLEKLTEMGGLRKKRIDGKKGKEFKGRRGWYAISIAPENIHLLLSRSGCVVFLSSFFFLFFSVAFYATRIDKNTGTYPFSIALQSSILRYKVFRNYWYEKKTIDYYSSILKWKYRIWIFWGGFWENWFKVMKNIGNFILNFKLLFGIINDDIYLIYFDQNYKFLFPLFNYINIKKYFKGIR